MNKKIATLALTGILACSLMVPAFAAEAVVAPNPIAAEE